MPSPEDTFQPETMALPEQPASADQRVVTMTCFTKPDPAGAPLCQGHLGFLGNGRLQTCYALLYPRRLDAYDTADDLLMMRPPRITIKLAHVQGFETLSSGLILDVKDRVCE